MIIWFTGQPGSGKSTLARAVATALRGNGLKVAELDGEEFRRQTGNNDYSDAGRIRNVRGAQERAGELVAGGFTVVASFVSPHRSLREDFKAKQNVLEFYVHTSCITGKEEFHVLNYEPPLRDYLSLDTSTLTIDQCVALILKLCAQSQTDLPDPRFQVSRST